ncbi:MAG: hypothetical protein KGO96_10300 [Elusimicrobia bacterium]|nr:hypothetical protein [Elusimicrobiota bacterium]
MITISPTTYSDCPIPRLKLAYLATFNRTSGLLNGRSADGMKMAYVRYPEGFRSVDMPVGNAADYARVFGGTVCYAKGR